MTQSLELKKNHKVLEIGTGSGYQCSIISLLVRRVYTIERIKSLLINAEKKFHKLKLTNIVTKFDDGNLGWKEQIPFDRIIFTAATKNISRLFIDHISENGIIIAPIIEGSKQVLKKFTKKNKKILIKNLSDVLFVPNLEGVRS